MSHEKDRDHRPVPAAHPPREPEPLVSRDCPDRKRREHPTAEPREPEDPRQHPDRRRVSS